MRLVVPTLSYNLCHGRHMLQIYKQLNFAMGQQGNAHQIFLVHFIAIHLDLTAPSA